MEVNKVDGKLISGYIAVIFTITMKNNLGKYRSKVDKLDNSIFILIKKRTR